MELLLETAFFSIVCSLFFFNIVHRHPNFKIYQFPAMRRRKTLTALKRRIAKTSVSLCLLFEIRILFSQVLVIISSDGETIQDDVGVTFDLLLVPSCSDMY